MAIDSAEKRRSVAGVRWRVVKGITPNASKDQEWRQQAAWSYSGILAGGETESDFVPRLTLLGVG